MMTRTLMIMAVLAHWASVSESTYLCSPGNQGDVTSFLQNVCLRERDGVGFHGNLLHYVQNKQHLHFTAVLTDKHLWITNVLVQYFLTLFYTKPRQSLNVWLPGQKTIQRHPDSFHICIHSFSRNMHDLMLLFARFRSWTYYPWQQQPIVGISSKNINQNLVQKGPLPFCSLWPDPFE